jgi:glycosyltransferase involved in cell wall biosynthesis
MSVSVIIPVRDGEAYLAEAISSALLQKEAAEVIVVDDGSQDRTPDVVAHMNDERLIYVRQERLGAAAARNRGVDCARADLLAFLDADDLWSPGKLAAQTRALATGGVDIVFTGIEEFVSPELSLDEASSLLPRAGPLPGVSVVTMLMRRADFMRVGRFDEAIGTGEFLHWFARAQEIGLASLTLPQVYARRRLHLANHGRLFAADRGAYAAILRDMLQRRRRAVRS